MKRILVIDDDTQIREMLREILEREGYQVEDAKNGREASAIHRNKPTDLVITDLIMPEQDGIETIMEFIEKYPTIKIIAISGGGRIGSHDYLEMAQALGAAKTFRKPFKRAEIVQAVSELIGS